jgi:hypothetical protein
MQLLDDWKAILTRAWSMRFMLLASLFGALELALPAFEGLMPPKVFAVASLTFTFLAAISRLVAQPSLHPDAEKP